jgi:hypothetical protein
VAFEREHPIVTFMSMEFLTVPKPEVKCVASDDYDAKPKF